jgi:hypothetical protein
MSKYAEHKTAARERAIQWQSEFDKHNYSWGELAEWSDYFTKLAKRYGLVEEFKENGII